MVYRSAARRTVASSVAVAATAVAAACVVSVAVLPSHSVSGGVFQCVSAAETLPPSPPPTDGASATNSHGEGDADHHHHHHSCIHDTQALRRAIYQYHRAGGGGGASGSGGSDSTTTSATTTTTTADTGDAGGGAVSGLLAGPSYHVVELSRRSNTPVGDGVIGVGGGADDGSGAPRRDVDANEGDDNSAVFTMAVIDTDDDVAGDAHDGSAAKKGTAARSTPFVSFKHHQEALLKRHAAAGKGRFATAASNAKPIRIKFRTDALTQTSPPLFCTGPTGEVPNFLDGTSKCSDEVVFSPEQRELLINTVLPHAAEIISGYLSVIPAASLLSTIKVPANICGEQMPIPLDDQTVGVSDSDIVIYIGAAPNTNQAAIAWAGMCALNKQGRPVVARANFSPRYLDPTSTRYSVEAVISTAVHEILHALGFVPVWVDSSAFAIENAIVLDQTRRGGQPVALYKGPAVLEAARKQLGCDTLDGVELENDGGTKTASAHWERRFHRDDIMCGMASKTMALTEMSFALLEDSGHYFLNREYIPSGNMNTIGGGEAVAGNGQQCSADAPTSAAATTNTAVIKKKTSSSTNPIGLVAQSATQSPFETPLYMYREGCGVFNEKCNTKAGGAGTYFCFERDRTKKMCTDDYAAIGFCNTANYGSGVIPSWAQYFQGSTTLGGAEQLNDFCPIVEYYTNYQCNTAAFTSSMSGSSSTGGTNNVVKGLYFGNDGRCFETSEDFIVSGRSYDGFSLQSPGAARCLRARCVDGAYIQFSVAGGDGDTAASQWASCPLDGSEGTAKAPTGYKGTVECPLASRFCTSDLYYPSAALSAGGECSTPASITTAASPHGGGGDGTEPPAMTLSSSPSSEDTGQGSNETDSVFPIPPSGLRENGANLRLGTAAVASGALGAALLLVMAAV